MRIFIGIDIDSKIRQRLADYMADLQRTEPDVKWVKAESLHVTLRFVGEFPETRLNEMKEALAAVSGAQFEIAFHDVGFFTPRSPRVFWVGVHAGPQLAALAHAVEDATAALGVAREERDYHPHLTLARSGSGRPQGSPRDRTLPQMLLLKQHLEGEPEPRFGPPKQQYCTPAFGTMTAREFILFQSKTAPTGAVYTKLERYALHE